MPLSHRQDASGAKRDSLLPQLLQLIERQHVPSDPEAPPSAVEQGLALNRAFLKVSSDNNRAILVALANALAAR